MTLNEIIKAFVPNNMLEGRTKIYIEHFSRDRHYIIDERDTVENRLAILQRFKDDPVVMMKAIDKDTLKVFIY